MKGSENALLILGGTSKIYLEQYSRSPVLSNFEIFGCSGEPKKLPSYPMDLFGPSMTWEGVSLASIS